MAWNCDTDGLLPVSKAKEIILGAINVVKEIEEVSLDDALNRVLAVDVSSPINVPAYDNSAMDGYALRHEDLTNTSQFQLVGKSFAGNAFSHRIEPGECVRIMTGAELPKGADTVIMQENAEVEGDSVSFTVAVDKGEAVRPKGDDIQEGASVLPSGKKLSPIDIGLLASLGCDKVEVYRKIKVAVFSTGDELLSVGEAARSDRIFDTNRPMLKAMLTSLGAEVIDLGIIPDDRALIQQTFERADQEADCVITSGGVSVGEADYTKEVLDEYGDIDFWKLAIKPGKPLAFGRLKKSVFFGLPGNPVSSAVTFDQIATPALKCMAGQLPSSGIQLQAEASSVFRKRPGRADYQRATFFTNDEGLLCVQSAGSQSSGVLSCFSNSNCYALIEQERGRVEIGENLTILPFSSLIQSSD